MSDYTPKPVLPDFFAPKPISGALTYTPTTEEIRLNALRQNATTDITDAEFDRWLAEVKTEANIELVARIEAAVILLGDDDITPTGRRMISKVLNPYRRGEEQ